MKDIRGYDNNLRHSQSEFTIFDPPPKTIEDHSVRDPKTAFQGVTRIRIFNLPPTMWGLENVTHLFVVEFGGERKDARLRIQREDVVGPVRDDRVGELRVGVQVRVRGRDHAHLVAAWRILRDVERIGGLIEHRWIVVGVRHLNQSNHSSSSIRWVYMERDTRDDGKKINKRSTGERNN